jgi:hypothetical protein
LLEQVINSEKGNQPPADAERAAARS